MTINIWEERIVKDDGRREPEKAFKYFNEYLLLGGGRTLRKVAEQTGKSYKYMEKLSCTWDWSNRFGCISSGSAWREYKFQFNFIRCI